MFLTLLTEAYANKVAAQFASVTTGTQADWLNQTYRPAGTWVLQNVVHQPLELVGIHRHGLLDFADTSDLATKPIACTSQSTPTAAVTLFTINTRSLATR